MIVEGNNLIEHYGLSVPLERQISTDERVKDDSKWPKIGLLAVASLDYFWSHVVGGACDLLQILSLVGVDREAKVNQAHSVAGCDHDVVWFDISMNDILCMAMIYRLE